MSIRNSLISKSSCLLLILLCTHSIIAQKPRLSIEAAVPVTVIGSEQILESRSFSIGNLTETILRSPKTHNVVQRTSRYDYRTAGGGMRIDNFYFDNQDQPAYLNSVTSDINSIPISVIEEIRSVNVIQQGYKWTNFPGSQSSFQYSIDAKQYKPVSFRADYKLQWKAPAYNDISETVSNTIWKEKLNKILEKKTETETKTDDTYGKGGTAEYKYKPFSGYNNVEIETIQYKDLNGTVRQESYREYYSDGFMYEEVTYYDCNGKPVHFDSSMYDDYGDEYEYTEIEYKNGVAVAGYRDIEDEDEKGYYDYREYYNPLTGQFEQNRMADGGWSLYKDYQYDGPSLSVCGDFPRNQVFLAGSLLREDAKPGFNLYGGLVDYTRFLNSKIGITADMRFNAGSMNSTKYNKLNFMAGITYVPIKDAGLDDRYTFSVHAFAGVVNLKSKYGMYSNSQTLFNAVIGPRFDYNFCSGLGAGVQLELNPVFPKGGGNTSYNFSSGIGVRYSF